MYRPESIIARKASLRTYSLSASPLPIENVLPPRQASASNAEAELSGWSENLSVSSRGYMLGYNDLKDPSVSGLFRLLARVGDHMMKMQIVRLSFRER